MIAPMPECQLTPYPATYRQALTPQSGVHGNLGGGATARADNGCSGRDLPGCACPIVEVPE